MKYIFSLILAISALSPIWADETVNLTLRTATGDDYSFPADNLVLVVADGKLTAQSSAGEQSFDLTELKSMSFTPGTVSVATLNTIPGEVRIFSAAGIDLGVYDNAVEAIRNLSSGIYVIKTSTETIKICVP